MPRFFRSSQRFGQLPIEWTYQNDNNGANLGYIVVDTGYSIAKTMEPVGIDLKNQEQREIYFS